MANAFEDDIKSGDFHRCYLLAGDEPYLVKYRKNSLIKALVKEGDEMNLTVFDEKDIDASNISKVKDIAETMPFFAEKRVVVLENSGLFKNQNDMADYIADIPKTTVIIFAEKEIDKRNRLYKAVGKYGLVVDCAPMAPETLLSWVGALFKRGERRITKSTASYLVERVGQDMFTLSNEIAKLIAFTEGRDIVEEADINAVCAKRPQDQIFKMMDAIGRKDEKAALEFYFDLLKMGEPPLRILYMLNRHFHILLQIKDLMKRGRQSEAASLLKIPPFTVKNYAAQAGHFNEKVLYEAFNEGVATDEAIKTGQAIDQIAVEELIIKYSLK